MLTKKSLAIPIGPDPKGWADIRSAWSRHQVANHGGRNMETLRDFLVLMLADLEKQPERLSPEAYARFFDTMSRSVPWNTFGLYDSNIRVPIVISLAILAQKSEHVKSQSGRSVLAQYRFQMKTVFNGALAQSSSWPHLYEDMLKYFQSPLLPIYKLCLLKELAFPEVWLHSEMRENVKALLPIKEDDAFQYLVWDTWNPASNKELVRVFLPTVYTLLNLTLDESAWKNQTTVANALKSFAPTRKTKAERAEFELPVDFLGEP